MALTDHVAILLSHSLDRAVPNKKNPQKIEFYALIAFAPEACPAVGEMVQKIYPGIPVGNVEFNCKPNSQQKKPFVGIPDNFYILRLSSRFAPELYAADGTTVIPNTEARSRFYAGMKVRVAGGAWPRVADNGPGASFNLFGVMDAGVGGDRISVGSGQTGAAFAAHANPNAVNQGQNPGNPFGGATNGSAAPAAPTAQPAASVASNTVAQSQSSNPFQQQTSGAGAQSANPFA